VDAGARHLTPVAVFLILATLLLMALSPACPHAEDTTGVALPVMSSAAEPVEDGGGGDASCTAASDLLGVTARGTDAPRLDVDAYGSDASIGQEAGPPRLHIPSAAREHPGHPHGRDLLLVLEIART
jgi:hypothetical protein